MKVLISAYSCQPGAGSEQGAGWSWSRAAATEHDVWVMTRALNAEPIAAALAREPDLQFTPVYIDLPPWARFWKFWPLGIYLYYAIWQTMAWRTARRLHRRERFDVAHHLTFAVDWMPAGVAYVPGLPLIWGPVGGATATPFRLWRWFGTAGMAKEAARESITRAARRLFGDAACARASVVLTQNEDVAKRFRRGSIVRVEPNMAIDLPDRGVVDREPRSAIFVGRLLYWKGVRIALAAFREPVLSDWTLDIFGEGPERRSLERLARRFGISDRVRFHGMVPRHEILEAFSRNEVLLFPSLHEAGGWVVAEAVAHGCGVVCLDIGGPATILRRAGVGTRVGVRGPLARNVARAVAASTCPPPAAPLSEARLPALIGEIYRLAGAGEGV